MTQVTVLLLCRLSYKGLGEPLCFWAFGPLATTAFYLACQTAPSTLAYTAAAVNTGAAHPALPVLAGVSSLLQLLSVVVGITTTVILFCSHWHQIQGDLAAGKMSPLVRLGTARACKVGVQQQMHAPVIDESSESCLRHGTDHEWCCVPASQRYVAL